MVDRIRPHVRGARDPVRHVEEARDRGDVPDVARREPGLAQRRAVRLLDRPRFGRELDGEIEHGALARREPRRPKIHHHQLAQHRVLAQSAHRGAVRRQAVVAAVHRRHRDRDHLALELGKAGGREHEIVVHGDERLELAHVERVSAQHVGHEAELLLAFLEVGCHGIARRRLLEAERRDEDVVVGGLAARRSAAFLSAGARAGLAFHPGCRAIARLLSVLGHGSLPRCGLLATAYSSRAHRRNTNCSRRMRRDRRHCGHTESARASGPASGTNDAVLSMSMTSTQPARVAGLGPAGDDGARALIQAAGPLIGGSAPKNFVDLLLGRAAPEDLLAYQARDLARLAQDAWAFLGERRPGTAKVRIVSPVDGDRLNAISVIEIINDDKPFLLDSTMGQLAELGVEIRLVAHPLVTVARDADGLLTDFGSGPLRESFIHIHTERIPDEARRSRIVKALGDAHNEIHLAVSHWRPMLERVDEVIADLKANPPPLPPAEVAEAVEFLQWLLMDNFTFLGVRSDAYDDTTGVLAEQPGSVLGILHHRPSEVLTAGGERLALPAAGRAMLHEPQALIVIKTNQRSRVHRNVTMDLVGVKRYDPSGRLVGVFRVVGLFTSTAYTRSTAGIPYLRRKTASVISRAGLGANSHSGKALAAVLEQYPRDELFAIDEDTLLGFGLAILQLEERPRVRVLARRDRFDRFVSVLVYVPRDRFDSTVREEIGALLADAYRGRAASFTP